MAVQLMSKYIANNLKSQGCTERKTFTLQPPNIEKHLIPAFLKGAIDGDGGVYFKEKIQHCNGNKYWQFKIHFCSASLPFITWINEQWKNLCGHANSIGKNKNTYQTQISGMYAFWLAKILYFTNSPHLTRKHSKFLQAQSYYTS